MDFLHVIILSIIEGITEFLPISSTGHLVLAAKLMQIPQTSFVKSFEIIIQLGAIMAIVALYWEKLTQGFEIWKKIIVAFIPTGILGLIFYKIIKSYLLGNSLITILSLLIGGIVLILIELKHKESADDSDSIEKISYKNACIIGLAQSVSMIPGVSRAAATILGAMLLKTKRRTAVEFSFLLAIPTMAAATGLDLLKSSLHFTSSEYMQLGIGFIGAFITAFIVVKYFIKYVKKHTLLPFGVYRIILALIFFFFLYK